MDFVRMQLPNNNDRYRGMEHPLLSSRLDKPVCDSDEFDAIDRSLSRQGRHAESTIPTPSPAGRLAMVMALALVVTSTIGCDRPGGPQPARANAPDSETVIAQSPVDVARRINELRLAGNFAQLEPLLIPERSAETIRMLKTVTQLADAHQQLQSVAVQRFGSRVRHAWNLGDLENNLGIFSKDIEILAQHFEGDGATVTIQVARRVPLLRAAFERRGNRWCYVPDPIQASSIDALAQLTTDIKHVESALANNMSPQAYHEAVLNKLIPGMIRVVQGQPQQDDDVRVTDAKDATGEP